MDPAALSNAGDEFHVLWAARRCLKLLDPRGDLKAVRMEGVAQDDRASETDDLMLGVDLAEYWGGPDFDQARLVEISQLKYSTQHPERAWTAARLAKKPTRNGASPIRRLANVFKSFSTQDRRVLVSRLRIRLVSNQPVDGTLLSTLGRASSVQVTQPSSIAALSQGMNESERAELGKLHLASGLSGQAFADFVRLLDVSDCGAEPRALQGIRLLQEASPFLGHGRTAGTTGLVALVAAQAQPDRFGQPLTAGVVRAALGIIDDEDLFPAPPKFRPPGQLISTNAGTALAAELRSAPGPVLVHGEAGSGKTTTALTLADAMSDAVVIAFDTFGDGEYDDDRRDRHSPFAVLPEIANELATLGVSDFLTVPRGDRVRAWRLFEQRLEEAAASLERQGQLLVIVVDAADNGAVAAQKRSELSIFPAFWTMPLPVNVRVVVTCRTHRRQLLAPPPTVIQFAIRGFAESESASHLRARYPGATDAECKEFHSASAGNPRVQSYSLDVVSAGEEGLRATLQAAHKSPTNMFDDLFGAAHEISPHHAREWILSLVCLTRPIEVEEYARVWGISRRNSMPTR